MTLDQILDQMLARDEGTEHTAYPDPLSHGEPYTIGRGHTGPEVHPGLVWDDNQIDDAYQLDKATAIQGCFDNFEPWFSALCPERQAVLAAMIFQMGVGRVLKFTDTLSAIRDQHFAHAAECLRASIWAHQTPKRALRMAYQLESGAIQ